MQAREALNEPPPFVQNRLGEVGAKHLGTIQTCSSPAGKPRFVVRELSNITDQPRSKGREEKTETQFRKLRGKDGICPTAPRSLGT